MAYLHPDYLPPEEGGQPSDEDSNYSRSLTVAADGEIIPIIYGTVQTKGKVFAANLHTDNFWYIGILWCIGEIGAIYNVYFGDTLVPLTDLQHHLGTIDQVADTWLAAAIIGYDDPLVMTINGETRGVAYTVVKLSEEDVTTQFTATIDGTVVCDYIGTPGEPSEPLPPTNPPVETFPAGTFVTTWRLSQLQLDAWEEAGTTFAYPALESSIGGGPPVFTIDWGDGSAVENVTAEFPTHVYAYAGTYDIIVDGYCPRVKTGFFDFNGGENPDRYEYYSLLNDIKQWGNVGFEDLYGSFCWHYDDLIYITATDGGTSGTFSNVTDMGYFLIDAGNLRYIDVSDWDVGNSTSFLGFFSRNDVLSTCDVSNWDVSSGIDFSFMFASCYLLDSEVGSWNTSNATNMESMFDNARLMDPDCSNWDISNVTNMIDMFKDSGLTTTNYTNILKKWALLSVQPGISLRADNYASGLVPYDSSAQSARDILTGAPNNWNIIDGGSI